MTSISNRINFLKDYWETEKLFITGKLLANKKQAKKIKPYVAMLNEMTDILKEKIIKEYF